MLSTLKTHLLLCQISREFKHGGGGKESLGVDRRQEEIYLS